MTSYTLTEIASLLEQASLPVSGPLADDLRNAAKLLRNMRHIRTGFRAGGQGVTFEARYSGESLNRLREFARRRGLTLHDAFGHLQDVSYVYLTYADRKGVSHVEG
jgi:hypothetical protein